MMEWWLIVSGAFNIGLAVVVASQYFGWKAAEERADKYQEAFNANDKDNARMRYELHQANGDIRELREMLKRYADKVFQEDEDVWLAVFKSGVEEDKE